MHGDNTYDGAERFHQDRRAHRRIVHTRFRPLADEDGRDASIGAAGAARGGPRRRRGEGLRAMAVLPPVTFEPDVPRRAFDELCAASLACAEPGGSGHRHAYECVAAVLADERAVAVRSTGG